MAPRHMAAATISEIQAPNVGPGRDGFPGLPYLHDLLAKAMASAQNGDSPVVPGLQLSKFKVHTVTQEFLDSLLREAEALDSREKANLTRAKRAEDKLAQREEQLSQANDKVKTLKDQVVILLNAEKDTHQKELSEANGVTMPRLEAQIQEDARLVSELRKRAEIAEQRHLQVTEELRAEKLKKHHLNSSDHKSTAASRDRSATPASSQMISNEATSSIHLMPRGKGKIRKSTATPAQTSAKRATRSENTAERSKPQRRNGPSSSLPAGPVTTRTSTDNGPTPIDPATPSRIGKGRLAAAPTSSKSDPLTRGV